MHITVVRAVPLARSLGRCLTRSGEGGGSVSRAMTAPSGGRRGMGGERGRARGWGAARGARRSARRRVRAGVVAGASGLEARPGPAPSDEDKAAGPRAAGDKVDDGAAPSSYAYVEVGGVLDAHSLRGEVKLLPFTDYSEQRFAAGSTLYVTDNTEMVRNRHRRRRHAAEDRIAADIETAGARARVTVERSRTSVSGGREVLLVKFRGVNNRTQADALKGKTVLIRAEIPGGAGGRARGGGGDGEGAAPGGEGAALGASSGGGAPEPGGTGDEFYAPHLEGIAVVLRDSREELGTVVDVYSGTGTYDTLKVELHSEVLESLVRRSGAASDAGGSGAGEGGEGVGEEEDFSGGVLYVPFVKEFVPVVDIPGRRCEISPVDGLLELAVTNYASRRDASARRRKKRAGGRSRRL